MSSTQSLACFAAPADAGRSSTAARLAAYTLVAGSGFYLTQVVDVSPIYFLVGASAVLAVAAASGSTFTRPALPWVSLSALVVQLLYSSTVSEPHAVLAYTLNVVCLALAAFVFSRLTKQDLCRCRALLVRFTIALGAIEAAVRWLFPFQELPADKLQHMEVSGALFYQYKFNSLMYMDSNFVGMWLLVVVLFQLHATPADHRSRGWRVEALCLLALLALSICRAAILAVAAYFALRLALQGRRRRIRAWHIALASLTVAAAVGWFFSEMAQDESFQSKLVIFDLIVNGYLSSARLEALLLGTGVASSADVLGGIAAHNYFAMLFIECGVVGLVFTLSVHFFFVRRCRSAAGPLLGCFYFAGLSMAPMTAPYLYVALALATELARRGLINGGSRARPPDAVQGAVHVTRALQTEEAV
jgi:hypothetical protein